MSDTEPTTAEEVAAEAVATYICFTLGRGLLDPNEPTVHESDRKQAAAIVAALRSSPAALADLNGGEWVALSPATAMTPEDARRYGYHMDGHFYDHNGVRFNPEPVYRFVPREDPR